MFNLSKPKPKTGRRKLMSSPEKCTPLSFIVVSVFMLFLLSACGGSSNAPTVTPPAASQGQGWGADGTEIKEGPASGVETTNIDEQGIKGPGQFGEGVSEGRTSGPMLPVYFDFDSFTIRPDMKQRMDANAEFLLANPTVRIEIQGNCDDRGTNEYNIALGEKRAMAAKRYLINKGIDPERMDVVSFGEERPLDPAQTPEAWAKNRRDDFVITGR